MSSDSEESILPVKYRMSSESDDEDFLPNPSMHLGGDDYVDYNMLSGVHRAVFHGNIHRLHYLVAKGRSTNRRDNNGNTPLHLAVSNPATDPNIVDFLLLCGCYGDTDINARNFFGETPLFLAAKFGNIEGVKKLLESNANVNLQNTHNVTPLHIVSGEPEIALLLLQHGANVNAQDYSGETPLHEAVSREHLETVCMFLYHDVDVTINCEHGLNAFMRALVENNHEIQTVLIDYIADFNATARNGQSTLGIALIQRSPLVEEIIRRGADINYQHPQYNHVLMCCESPDETNFRLIWENFEYQQLYGITYWESITNINDLNMVHAFLRVIIETENITPFVEESNFVPNLEFLSRIPDSDLQEWESTLSKLIFMFLMAGLTLTNVHLDSIFDKFKLRALFRTLAEADFVIVSDDITVARLFYDLTLTVEEFMIAYEHQNRFECNDLRILTKYIRHPLIQDYFHLPRELPSLFEIARNQVRSCLKGVGQQPRQCLNSLQIPKICKDVIAFKVPIYF